MRAQSWTGFHNLVLLLFVPALAATAFLGARIPTSVSPGSIWDGYTVLLVNRTLPVAEVTRELEAAGVQNVISFSTAEVRYNDVDRLGVVPAQEIEDRFLEYDPRLDPFMQELDAFFFTADGEVEYAIYYIDDERSRAHLAQLIRDRVSEIARETEVSGESRPAWRFADTDSPDSRLFAIGFIVFAALLMSYLRTALLTLSLGAILAMLQLARAGPGVLFSLTVLYLLWAVVLRDLTRDLPQRLTGYGPRNLKTRWTVQGLFALVLLAASGLYAYRIDGTGVALLHLVVVTVGFALLTSALVTRMVLKHRQAEHRLFQPVEIIPSRVRGRRRHRSKRGPRFAAGPPLPRLEGVATTRGLLLVLIAAGVAAAWATALLPAGGGVAVPTPLRIPGADDLSHSSIARLERYRFDDGLPDLAMYLTHRAYHEAFMYGREFVFPQPGEEVTRERYRREAGGITQETEVALRFNDEWVDRVRSETPAGSPMRMLWDQEEAVGVVFDSRPAIYSGRSIVIRHGALVAAALLPVLFSSVFAPHAGRSRAVSAEHAAEREKTNQEA